MFTATPQTAGNGVAIIRATCDCCGRKEHDPNVYCDFQSQTMTVKCSTCGNLIPTESR